MKDITPAETGRVYKKITDRIQVLRRQIWEEDEAANESLVKHLKKELDILEELVK